MEQESFPLLKVTLTLCPLLPHFDLNSPVELHVDARGYGVVAVLVQHVLGSVYPIARTQQSGMPDSCLGSH